MQETHDNPQTLLIWRSPLRPFVKREPRIIRFYLLLGGLVSILVLFFNDWMAILPVWALIFIAYVFTVIEPPEVVHRITQFGIETAGTTFRWESLSHFYYTSRLRYTQLVLVTHEPYSTHTYIIIPKEIQMQITEQLTKHLIYFDKAPRTLVDRIGEFFSQFLLQEDDADTVTQQTSSQTVSQKGAQATL